MLGIKAQAQDINGKTYNRWTMLSVIIIGAFCTILNQTILATAFPTLMHTFNVSTATVQWLTTAFLMVNGIVIPITAYLTNRVNSKWLFITAMIIFECGTIVAFKAPNFGTLLTARIIQALGVGISMPLVQNLALSMFPPEQRGVIIGLVGIPIGVAPAIGPTLSGWIIDNYSWRDLFGMLIPIVAIVIILAFFALHPVIKNKKDSIDIPSVILSTIGFGLLLYGFSSVGNDGWTAKNVIWSIIVGAIVVVIFSIRQLKLKNPFLEIRVFKSPIFTLSTVLASFTMICMMGVEFVLPLYLQIVHQMSAFHSGLTLLPGALMMSIMNPITGRTFDKQGARRLAIIGLFILFFSTMPFVTLTKHTSTTLVTVLYAVRMFGITMVTMPVTTAAMNSLPNSLIAHGTAVNNTTRQIATSIGTAILISVLTNVSNNHMPSHSLLHTAPLKYKSQALTATLTGYHTTFLVALIFGLIALILSFFLKKGNFILNQKKATNYNTNGGPK